PSWLFSFDAVQLINQSPNPISSRLARSIGCQCSSACKRKESNNSISRLIPSPFPFTLVSLCLSHSSLSSHFHLVAASLLFKSTLLYSLASPSPISPTNNVRSLLIFSSVVSSWFEHLPSLSFLLSPRVHCIFFLF